MSSLDSHEFERLKKPQLLELAKELRLDVSDALQKPELIDSLLAVGAEDDELSECIELINERKTAKRQAAEAERQGEKFQQERERQKPLQEEEKQKREQELEPGNSYSRRKKKSVDMKGRLNVLNWKCRELEFRVTAACRLRRLSDLRSE